MRQFAGQCRTVAARKRDWIIPTVVTLRGTPNLGLAVNELNILIFHPPPQLLPMSSPCVDQAQPQQQQIHPQQQQTPNTEKPFSSENSSTSNNKNLINNSQGDTKSSLSAQAGGADDRLGGETSSPANINNISTVKVNSSSSSGKRKMDFGGSSNSNSNSANYSGIASGNVSGNSVNSATASLAQLLLKRPTLLSQDYENIVEDELDPHQLLYDYTSSDAW